MEMTLITSLNQKAKQTRKDILEMIAAAASGHPGGSLSATDIIVTLYYHKMNHNPKNPKWPDRDRFVLSKGHCCPALYSVLARSGYFPVSKLNGLRKIGSMLQGHPNMKSTPGIEMSTGSLGQGLSVANGIALAGKLDKKSYNVYCMVGCGESQEGQIWEAAMTAAHYKLDNIIGIQDNNRLQIDGFTDCVKCIDPITEKWRAFGWHAIEINGHDFNEIIAALDEADKIKNKPTMIVANTIKGKGISFMEDKVGWHGKAPSKEQLKEALEELR
jgi:transketolase